MGNPVCFRGFFSPFGYCDNIVYFVGRLVWIEFGPPSRPTIKICFYLILFMAFSGVLR